MAKKKPYFETTCSRHGHVEGADTAHIKRVKTGTPAYPPRRNLGGREEELKMLPPSATI